MSTAIVRYKKPGRASRWQWILGLSPNHSSSGGWMSCLDESPRGKTKTSKGVTPKGKFTAMARECLVRIVSHPTWKHFRKFEEVHYVHHDIWTKTPQIIMSVGIWTPIICTNDVDARNMIQVFDATTHFPGITPGGVETCWNLLTFKTLSTCSCWNLQVMVYLINRKTSEFPSATFIRLNFEVLLAMLMALAVMLLSEIKGLSLGKSGRVIESVICFGWVGKAVQWMAKMRRKKNISGNLQGFGFEAVEADSPKKTWERGRRLAWIDKKERFKKQGQLYKWWHC